MTEDDQPKDKEAPVDDHRSATTMPEGNPNHPDIPPEGHDAKSERPGGPGQTGMNPVAPGRVTPGPDQEAPEPDDATKARRERLRREHGEASDEVD